MRLKLYYFLTAIVILATTYSAKGSAEDANNSKSPEKPNILFIIVDDLKPMLGVYGDKNIKSPNIDALAKRGVLFSNAYCQQAVCAPSRVSVFTGLRPDRTRVWDLKTNMRDENPDVVTLPGFFRSHGYETAGFGKLLHGAKDNDPDSWSIPYKNDKELSYAEGFRYPANGKFQALEIQDAMKVAKQKKLNWGETNKYLKELGLAPSTECLDIPDNAYSDGAVAAAGVEMLETLGNTGKPFFLALGFHKPHLPFVAPKRYWDLYERNEIELNPFQEEADHSPAFAYHGGMELRNYSDIPGTGPVDKEKQRELIHGYMACVSFVDNQVGKVLAKLDELGLRENTIVILWGDHGWHLGDHGLWCKHTNFEQATKAPLIISAPGLATGAYASGMTEFIDIYPTLCELTGLEGPEALEGQSLVPVLKDPQIIIKDFAISQYPRGNNIMGYSLRTEQYRLTLWFKGAFREGMIASAENIESLELYDYKLDPLETMSLARNPKYSKILETMKTKLLSVINNSDSIQID